MEIIYALGAGSRIVGVTGFAMRPPAARRKPRVSGFSSVNYDKVDVLKPDLIITFSDVQAEAAKELLRRGHVVLATNQRSLVQVFETIRMIGRVIRQGSAGGKAGDPDERGNFPKDRRRTRRPRVYFEEWNEPLISGIRWVGELIEAAGRGGHFSGTSHASAGTRPGGDRCGGDASPAGHHHCELVRQEGELR